MIAALVLPVCVCMVLGVIDISRAMTARATLQGALDRATLAAARSESYTDADLQSVGCKALEANLYGLEGTFVGATFKGNAKASSVAGAANAYVDTSILGLFGNDRIEVSAASTVVRASKNIETALILDVTGSMAGASLTSLKSAAADLVDIVVQTSQTPYFSKIAIVSYATGVNVGGYADKVRGSVAAGTCTAPGCQSFKFYNPYGLRETFGVTNCVSERTGANAYTDAAPSAAPVGLLYASPSNPCATSAVVPLTSDKTALKSAISKLVAGGSSAGQVGVAWGWYLLSPNFNALWPSNAAASYKADKLVKVAVLMTDGEYNSVYCDGVISRDSTSGSGSATDHINCNAPNGNSYSQSKKLCAAMKAAGVVVYTVGLNVIDTAAAKDLVESCATDSAHVFYPTNGASLQSAFQAIGHSISDLRIAN
jgi:Flp pilus assembly protein TadG